jgi:hypothetical protein
VLVDEVQGRLTFPRAGELNSIVVGLCCYGKPAITAQGVHSRARATADLPGRPDTPSAESLGATVPKPVGARPAIGRIAPAGSPPTTALSLLAGKLEAFTGIEMLLLCP